MSNVRSWFAWVDVRAGYADARRTASPRVWDGRKWGALDYTIGYAAGVIRP